MKCRTNKVELRLSLSGIFSILHMEMINDKCGAANHLLNQRARAGLRAKCRFLVFARKRRPPVTGKWAIFEFCPQKAALGYGQMGDF